MTVLTDMSAKGTQGSSDEMHSPCMACSTIETPLQVFRQHGYNTSLSGNRLPFYNLTELTHTFTTLNSSHAYLH